MARRSFASLVALASLTLIAAAPTAASAGVRDGASLGSMRGLHAELTAVGEGGGGVTSDETFAADARASVRDEALLLPADQDAEKHWYGWQTLLVDAVSIAAMPAAGVGFGGYLLGAPIVHATHDRWGIAAASLGLRVALPVAGAIAGLKFANCAPQMANTEGGDWCGVGEAIVGVGLGMLTAIAIDAAVFSYEPASAASAASDGAGSGASARRARNTTSVALTPWIERDRKGASLAITF
jgi:hypothetical protein